MLSRLQNDDETFERYLLRAQAVLTNVTVGLFAMLAALASPLFSILFAAEWQPSVQIFQWLALGGIFQAVSYPAYWVFLAKGLTRQNLICALVNRPFAIGGIAIGALWGVDGVAAGYTCGIFFAWPIEMLFINRYTTISGMKLFAQGLLPLTCWIGIAIGTYEIVGHLAVTNAFKSAGLGIIVFVMIACLVALIVKPFRTGLLTVTDFLQAARN